MNNNSISSFVRCLHQLSFVSEDFRFFEEKKLRQYTTTTISCDYNLKKQFIQWTISIRFIFFNPVVARRILVDSTKIQLKLLPSNSIGILNLLRLS